MKTVNQSFNKIDGKSLVSGKGNYTEDLAPTNALVIKVLRSPHAFARIKQIKTEFAKKVPGVELVLTWTDVPRIPFTRAGQCWPELSPCDTFILDEYVRHVGDAVAIVAATTEKAALKAIQVIKVDYEILEPLLDFEAADTSAVQVHPETSAYAQLPVGFDPQKNTVATVDWSLGDVDAVLKECPIVIQRTYRTQAQAQAMMETQRAFAYKDAYDRLVVVASTQIPFHVRRALSTALDLPMSQIRVIKPRIGGGFGAKQTLNAEFFPALVTQLTGKPSKLIYTRKEVFSGTNSRHAMKIDITLGAETNGKIRAIAIKGLSDTGAYGEHGSTTFGSVGAKMLTLYNKTDACRFSGKVVYTNHVPGGALRGFGVTQGTFAVESAVNELAECLKIDPVRLRQMNMIDQGETTPLYNKLTKGSGTDPIPMDSCLLHPCVLRGMTLSGWSEKRARYASVPTSAIKRRGIGMAVTQQGSGLPNIDMASAVLKLNDDGFFTLMMGATDIGTGSDTILCQIAAETLGVSMDKIIVYTADTDITPFDSGAYASSTTYTTGNAVIDAAQKMSTLIKEQGALHFNVPSDDITYDGNALTCVSSGESLSLRDLSRKITYSAGHTQLMACGSFVPKKPAPPYMACFAEVEVDTSTGKVEVLNFYGVVDCGMPINPKLCIIQAEGGAVQGIGMALMERAEYTAKGRLIHDSFMEYKIPARRDFGNIHIELADGHDESGPYGAKSIGEVVINAVPPAITEAIYNACGVRICQLPATPEKILMALSSES